MKFYYSDKYLIDIGAHVFPTEKYKFIKERLIKEGIAKDKDFIEPKKASDEDVLLVHTKGWIDKLKKGKLSIFDVFKLELPYSKELVEGSWICAQGTINACSDALESGVGIHIGGGFHHAYPNHGEGFCVLNDIAIGIRKMQKEGKIKKAMVIDCDLHQGNGTAKIFEKDKNVFTFSIHQQYNYPMPKEKSDLDIGLEDGVGDEEYLDHLKKHVPKIIRDFKPELFIYLAGADPYKEDQLGGLALTIEGLKKRDELVIGEARKNKIPVVIVFGGGYAYNVEDTVTIHVNTIKTALEIDKK